MVWNLVGSINHTYTTKHCEENRNTCGHCKKLMKNIERWKSKWGKDVRINIKKKKEAYLWFSDVTRRTKCRKAIVNENCF